MNVSHWASVKRRRTEKKSVPRASVSGPSLSTVMETPSQGRDLPLGPPGVLPFPVAEIATPPGGVPPAMTTPTDPAAPAAVVRAFLTDLERLDLDAACARLHPDVVYENKSLPAARGRDATRRVLGMLTSRATG